MPNRAKTMLNHTYTGPYNLDRDLPYYIMDRGS